MEDGRASHSRVRDLKTITTKFVNKKKKTNQIKMKTFFVATIALIGLSVCAATGPSSKYLPPNYAGAAPQPSNQYLAPHAGGGSGAGAHYHGVSGAAHYAAPPASHSAATRYGGGGGGHHGGAAVPILRNDFTHDVNSGNYNFGFETGNGIRRDEAGEFIGGWPHGSQSVKGSYSYTGDDGRVYTVKYTADENGFHAEGDHLPVNSQSHAGGHGGHGQSHGHGQGHGNSYGHSSGGYAGHQSAASSHSPSSQYLPPHQQQQQQHKQGGYNYARHRSH